MADSAAALVLSSSFLYNCMRNVFKIQGRLHAPQLHAELVFNVIVVPVILPKFVPARFGRPGCCTAKMCQIRLRIFPIYMRNALISGGKQVEAQSYRHLQQGTLRTRRPLLERQREVWLPAVVVPSPLFRPLWSWRQTPTCRYQWLWMSG